MQIWTGTFKCVIKEDNWFLTYSAILLIIPDQKNPGILAMVLLHDVSGSAHQAVSVLSERGWILHDVLAGSLF